MSGKGKPASPSRMSSRGSMRNMSPERGSSVGRDRRGSGAGTPGGGLDRSKSGLGPWGGATTGGKKTDEEEATALEKAGEAGKGRNGWGEHAPVPSAPAGDQRPRQPLNAYGEPFVSKETGLRRSSAGAVPAPDEEFIVLRYRKMVASVNYKLLDRGLGDESDDDEADPDDPPPPEGGEAAAYDSDDEGSVESVEVTMANAKVEWDVKDHKVPRPADYLELQRHFCALYPRHDAALAIERDGPEGETVPPWETRFVNGEVIVFREFTLPDKYAERPRGAHDWEVGHAKKLDKLVGCWEK